MEWVQGSRDRSAETVLRVLSGVHCTEAKNHDAYLLLPRGDLQLGIIWQPFADLFCPHTMRKQVEIRLNLFLPEISSTQPSKSIGRPIHLKSPTGGDGETLIITFFSSYFII